MAYTFWHSGVLIGESDFEENGRYPRQRAGIFRPTAYGIAIFPRLTGMMTAAVELKDEMHRRGFADETSPDALDLFENSDVGRKVLDIGKHLSEVEVRDPSGIAVEVASIAFIDLRELTTLSRRLELEQTTATLTSLPLEAPPYVVSATLRPQSPPPPPATPRWRAMN